MSIKSTSQGGNRWRRYLSQKLSAIPDKASYKRFLDGYVLMGKKVNGVARGTILDLPTKLLVADSASDQVGQILSFPVATISPSRDLFDPNAGGSRDAAKRGAETQFDQGYSEFYFGNAPLPAADSTRYATEIGFRGYTGTGMLRGGYCFSLESSELQLWPFDDNRRLWARAIATPRRFEQGLRVVIEEATLFSDSGGFLFFSRATGNQYYPDSCPVPSCDRRILADGTDLFVMAIPVVKDTGAYDATTNNRNFGYSAVYFLRGKRVPNTAGGVDFLVTDTWTISTEVFTTGPFSVPEWADPDRDWTGVMPNRFLGDVTLDEQGGIFWGGIIETSREVAGGDGQVAVRSIATVSIPLGGSPQVSRYYTTVCASSGTEADPYLALDSDPDNPVFPYWQKPSVTCYPGVGPMLVLEAVDLVRASINANYLATPDAASDRALWVVKDGLLSTYSTPGACVVDKSQDVNFKQDFRRVGPTLAVVDANYARPKVGLVMRGAPVYGDLVWVQLDLAQGAAVVLGTIDSGLPELDVPATVSCYQRGESTGVVGMPESTLTQPSGLVVSYSAAGTGVTAVSKDWGATWQPVANYAARVGTYYLGSGFTGYGLDTMYYEVQDNG